MITTQNLNLLIPGNKNVDEWCNSLNEFMPKYQINTTKRISSFISQCAHESGDFKILKENLNYRWETLRKLFPKYFPIDEIAQKYANAPDKQKIIANKVYANRMGNGPESSGDGFMYCGRGLIQLTGKENYQTFANSIKKNIEEIPDYLTTFQGAVHSACWFWDTRKINPLADVENIVRITEIINGGRNGLEDRIKRYNHAISILQNT